MPKKSTGARYPEEFKAEAVQLEPDPPPRSPSASSPTS